MRGADGTTLELERGDVGLFAFRMGGELFEGRLTHDGKRGSAFADVFVLRMCMLGYFLWKPRPSC